MSVTTINDPKVRIPRELYDDLKREVRLCRIEVMLDTDLTVTGYVRQALHEHMERVKAARLKGDRAHLSQFRCVVAAQGSAKP